RDGGDEGQHGLRYRTYRSVLDLPLRLGGEWAAVGKRHPRILRDNSTLRGQRDLQWHDRSVANLLGRRRRKGLGPERRAPGAFVEAPGASRQDLASALPRHHASGLRESAQCLRQLFYAALDARIDAGAHLGALLHRILDSSRGHGERIEVPE